MLQGPKKPIGTVKGSSTLKSQRGARLSVGSSTEEKEPALFSPGRVPTGLLGATAEKDIAVEVSPTPNNCDIEINSVCMGSTPTSIPLTEGTIVKVKLTKPGYLPWEKKVKIIRGVRISPELEKKPT